MAGKDFTPVAAEIIEPRQHLLHSSLFEQITSREALSVADTRSPAGLLFIHFSGGPQKFKMKTEKTVCLSFCKEILQDDSILSHAHKTWKYHDVLHKHKQTNFNQTNKQNSQFRTLQTSVTNKTKPVLKNIKG